MFRSTVRIDEKADVAAALERFQAECASSGIVARDAVCAEVDRTVWDLARRGGELVRVGSNMHVKRTIEGEDFNVLVVADFVAGKRSIFSRVRSALGLG